MIVAVAATHIVVEGSSLAVEVSAAVIAGLAFLWAVLTTVMRWPRVTVIARKNVWLTTGASPSRPGGQYRLLATVLNKGSEPITIEDVGWGSTLGGFSELSVGLQLEDAPESVEGPSLPCRIQGRDSATWEIAGSAICAKFGGTEKSELYAWAHRFAGHRRLPWGEKKRLWPWPEERRIARKTVRSDRFENPCAIAILEHRERQKTVG